jgi:hypothetical protein
MYFTNVAGFGFEQKLLPLVRQVEPDAVGPDHREDALLRNADRPQ